MKSAKHFSACPSGCPNGDVEPAEKPELIGERQPDHFLAQFFARVFTGPAHKVDRVLVRGRRGRRLQGDRRSRPLRRARRLLARGGQRPHHRRRPQQHGRRHRHPRPPAPPRTSSPEILTPTAARRRSSPLSSPSSSSSVTARRCATRRPASTSWTASRPAGSSAPLPGPAGLRAGRRNPADHRDHLGRVVREALGRELSG